MIHSAFPKSFDGETIDATLPAMESYCHSTKLEISSLAFGPPVDFSSLLWCLQSFTRGFWWFTRVSERFTLGFVKFTRELQILLGDPCFPAHPTNQSHQRSVQRRNEYEQNIHCPAHRHRANDWLIRVNTANGQLCELTGGTSAFACSFAAG